LIDEEDELGHFNPNINGRKKLKIKNRIEEAEEEEEFPHEPEIKFNVQQSIPNPKKP
jgi:hypothetical protein